MQKYGSKPSVSGLILQHLIVFLICIVFPGVVTSVAPATWLTFTRNGETVSCKTRTCMFFVLPFKNQNISEVTKVSQRELGGGTRRERKMGRETNNTIHVDGEGFLQIHGANETQIEISVSPASLSGVEMKANDFLQDKARISTTIFAIANWKFGALMGGVLTSFTALYVVGYSIATLRWIAKLFLKPFQSAVDTGRE